MSKTFEQIVQDVLSRVRQHPAERRSLELVRLIALGALWGNGALCPSDEHVNRLVDAVRDELAGEEAAPVGPAAEIAVSITGLRGSPARVAGELRQLAERVESGWLGTSSASGCDVSVLRPCSCALPSRGVDPEPGPCRVCGGHVPARRKEGTS